jgi:hypothetical protein
VRAHNFSGLFIGLVRGTPIIWQSAARLSPFPSLSLLMLRDPKKSRDSNWIEALKLPLSRLVSSMLYWIIPSIMTNNDAGCRHALNQSWENLSAGRATRRSRRRKINHLVLWLPFECGDTESTTLATIKACSNILSFLRYQKLQEAAYFISFLEFLCVHVT